MPGEVALLSERLAAALLLAAEGPLARVDPHVLGEVARFLELLAAAVVVALVALRYAMSGTQKKNVVLDFLGPKIIITRLNAARFQLSDSLSTKVKLQEFAKLHAFEVDVSPCREFSIFRWIYF